MKKQAMRFVMGMATGALLMGGLMMAVDAAGGLLAQPSNQTIYLDGKPITLTAYNIADNNYVKLRDIGEAVGFNVYWQDGVQIDSQSSYTGVAPGEELLSEPQVPQAEAPVTKASEDPDPAVDQDAICQDIIKCTNDLRKDNGLEALEVDPLLMRAAQVRADEMAATSIYSHIRPDGTRRTTVTDCIYTTENIHCVTASRMTDPGKELAPLVVKEWAESQSHLEGMLDNRRSAMGVGIARGINPANGKECWYCVQWFLRTGYSVTWVDEPITQK